jgi:hypothetical protein
MMGQNAIPIIELQQTDMTLAELLAQFKGQAVGFQLPHLEGVLLLLSEADYSFVTSAIQARQALPTRPTKTPAEYFAETVHVLRRLEQKYGMTSAEFYRRFQQGDLPEGPDDYWEWRTRYKSFLTMQDRFGFSEVQVVNG